MQHEMRGNYLHIEPGFGWFTGNLEQNHWHQHYALQLSFALDESLKIETENGIQTSDKAILLSPQLKHRILSQGQHLHLLFNPAHPIGHFWSALAQSPLMEVEHKAIELIILCTEKMEYWSIQWEQLNSLLRSYTCFCEDALHNGDLRINQALAYLDKNRERIVSLEEIAEQVHLSPSRFLHLFKIQTGISYRRAQNWNRLQLALESGMQGNLTEMAHAAGFSDSAHFSRSFKENFGFSPKEVLKNSHFIQV